MARKRSRPKPAPKKTLPKLDKAFACPFCSHNKSVECTLDKKLKVGVVTCNVCSESYATTIHGLTEPIDLYSEWIDECERVNSGEHYPSKRPSGRP